MEIEPAIVPFLIYSLISLLLVIYFNLKINLLHNKRLLNIIILLKIKLIKLNDAVLTVIVKIGPIPTQGKELFSFFLTFSKTTRSVKFYL